MAKQLLIDAYRGKMTPKAPWVPYAGVHCAFLINEPADKMLQDAELLAKGVVNAATRYKADGIPLLFDLSVEANSIGCDLKWWPDNVPSVTTHPCSDKTPAAAGLAIPTKDSGRWPVRSASTTASSCATRWCSGAARASRRAPTFAPATAASSTRSNAGSSSVFDSQRTVMVNEVLEGLKRPQKTISPKYFYDERGSELFEEITRLPMAL